MAVLVAPVLASVTLFTTSLFVSPLVVNAVELAP